MRFGSVYRKGGGWFARFPSGRKTASGRTSYTVRRVSSEAAGRKFLREICKAKNTKTFHDQGPTLSQGAETVADVVTAYISARDAEGRASGTLQQYRGALKAMVAHGIGNIAAPQLTADDVRSFLSWRRGHVFKAGKPVEGEASGATLYNDRGVLAATYNWLMNEGRVVVNPVRRVKPPRRRQTTKRPFELDEIAAFLSACDDDLRPMALCGFYTGLGEAELIALRWRDLSFPRSVLSIVREKNGRSVEIPLHAHLRAELETLRACRARDGRIPHAEECAFRSRYGRAYLTFPRAAWKTAIDRAGLTGRSLTPHSMRRTFATFYPGMDRDLQDILGHRDLATTLIYRRSRDERKRAGVEGLDYGLTGS